MTSKLVVNTIEADTGISSVSFASSISMDSTSKFHFSAAGVDIGADTNINRPAAGVLGFNISGAEKLRIDTNGHLNTSGIVTAANFKCGVTNVHNLGVTLTGGQFDGNLSFASGHGIDFSSQSTGAQLNSPTVDDEVLQYYEKGKWTPDVRKNGVSNATASPLHGRYVRIGQMVWLSMYARWASGSNAQGTSGGWQIYGLPFTIQDDNPGTCRIYQFAPAGYFYINGTYYGSARTIRWQCNNNTRLDLYTDLSSSQLAWNSGAMGITFTGCFMIHE